MHEIDPQLIIIIMTGYASVETAVQALKNGAYDYVTKPLDPDEIAHMVKKALSAPQHAATRTCACRRQWPRWRIRTNWSGRAPP